MIEFEAVKLVLELAHFFAVSFHLRVVAARCFHDLVDDKLRVASHIEASNPKLDSDFEPVDEGFIFRNVVRRGKMYSNDIPHVDAESETRSRPAPAPAFMRDPSKYIVHSSA